MCIGRVEMDGDRLDSGSIATSVCLGRGGGGGGGGGGAIGKP